MWFQLAPPPLWVPWLQAWLRQRQEEAVVQGHFFAFAFDFALAFFLGRSVFAHLQIAVVDAAATALDSWP